MPQLRRITGRRTHLTDTHRYFFVYSRAPTEAAFDRRRSVPLSLGADEVYQAGHDRRPGKR